MLKLVLGEAKVLPLTLSLINELRSVSPAIRSVTIGKTTLIQKPSRVAKKGVLTLSLSIVEKPSDLNEASELYPWVSQVKLICSLLGSR